LEEAFRTSLGRDNLDGLLSVCVRRATAPFVEFDAPHGANIAIVEDCVVALDAPIGGCDPSHPASIATATQPVSAQRPKAENFIPGS
jgi:hypothetical protein